ncbi:MAG TPA: response regulator [Candidatus Binatia bacterium]|nr:response regulator [Candidatus Binatia bacterium]
MTSPLVSDGPVLVVDDSLDTRQTMCAILEVAGYRVESAENGEEALLLLEEGMRPCLILLDIAMPRMDGIEFRARQVEDPRFANVPVVLFSGAYEVAKICRRLRVPGFQKPAEASQLLAIVAQHCRCG